MTELVWGLVAAGPLFLLLGVLLRPGRAEVIAEQRISAERMHGRSPQAPIQVSLWILGTLVVYRGLADLHRVAHGDAGTTTPGLLANGLMFLAGMLAAHGPTLLAANLIVWLIPRFRRADAMAREGLPRISLTRTNLGLLAYSALMIPTALAQGILGALEPWAR